MNLLSLDDKKNKQLTRDEVFQSLLYWRKELKKLFSAPSDSMSKEERNERLAYVEKMVRKAELLLYRPDEGLYLGIGYRLDSDKPKPEPVYAKWKNLNNHFGTLGTTRVGKTKSMLSHIDQCIAAGMDVIIVDPKGGENQEVPSSVVESCARFDRSADLMYFSPAHPSISQKINVIYGQSNISIASDIISSIRTPTMEDFYLDVGERILLAITTSFEYIQSCVDPDGTLAFELQVEEFEKYREFIERKKPSPVDKTEMSDIVDRFSSHIDIKWTENLFFNRDLINFRDLQKYSSYDGMVQLLSVVSAMPVPTEGGKRYPIEKIKKLREEAISLLNSALATDKAHFSKVSDTLANRLIQLSIGPVGDLLCDVRINPLMNRLLDKKRGVVAILQPFPMKYKRASGVFGKMMLGMLNSMMGTVGAEGVGLPRRVAVFLDEASVIAYPGIEDFFARAGGLGVTVFMYTQTGSDIESAVGSVLSEVIRGNINTTSFMRLKNPKDAYEVASLDIGLEKKHKTQTMVSLGGDNGRYTTDVTEEYIADPSDILALPSGEAIVVHDGVKYYMVNPYMPDPVGVVKMPELEGENIRSVVEEIEYAS